MRKIVCQCCKPRRDKRVLEGAIWIVFNGTFICESCRLAAIEYLREIVGLNLASVHPFLDELTAVDSAATTAIRA